MDTGGRLFPNISMNTPEEAHLALTLERMRTIKIEAKERPRYIFQWCPKCKYVGSCYDDKTGRGPNYLEPACGEGPA